MPHPNHEPPYPTSTTFDYRLREHERRKEQVENEGIVSTLADKQEQIESMKIDVEKNKEQMGALQDFVAAARGEDARTKKFLSWMLAVAAIAGITAPYLFGVPGVG